jgi:site-specific DNA-methyltransferase (adenine-specific)
LDGIVQNPGAAGTIDAVVMDPPYCSGGHSEAEKRGATHQGLRSDTIRQGKERWFSSDAMTTNGFLHLMRGVALHAYDLLRDGGSLLCFTDWRMLPTLAGTLESAGLRWQNVVVWDKGGPGLGTGFRPQHEMIVHCVKGTGTFHSLQGRNVYRVGRIRDRVHPTQKPVRLLEKLIEVVTSPGGTVLDPFMGSGSTGVACVNLGRWFVGIERDLEFYELARQRMAEAVETAEADD